MTRIVILALYAIFVSFYGFAEGGGEAVNGNQIDLVYSYRYPESLVADSIEEFLRREYDLIVNITFSDLLRDDGSWYENREKLQLYAATGECPVHALSLGWEPTSPLNEVYDVFRPIYPDQIQVYAPNYFTSILPKLAKYNRRDVTTGEPWYGLPGYRFLLEHSGFLIAARDAVFDDYDTHGGIEFVSAELPGATISRGEHITVDDLEEHLRTLRDTTRRIPFLAWDNFEHSFAPIYSAFGVSTVGRNLTNFSAESVPIVDGEPAQISSPLREAIGRLAEWYSEGLIGSDFPGATYSRAIQMASFAEVLSVPYLPTSIAPSALFREFVSGQSRGLLLEVTSSNGSGSQSRYYSPFRGYEAYTRCVTDQELEALLRIFDYTRWPGDPENPASVGEGWMRRVFGLPDEHYAASGSPSWIPAYRVRNVEPALPGRDQDSYAMWHFKSVPEFTLKVFDETRLLWRNEGSVSEVDDLGGLELNGRFSPPRDIRSSLPEEWYAEAETLSYITETFILSAIVGDSDTESDWHSYVAEWRKFGGDEVIEAIGSTW